MKRALTPQTSQYIAVKVTAVNMAQLTAHVRDKMEGDMVASFRDMVLSNQMPATGESWAAERIGFQWHLRYRILDDDAHTNAQAVGEGGRVIHAPGVIDIVGSQILANGVDVNETLLMILDALVPVSGSIDYYGSTEPANGNWKFPNGQELLIADYQEYYDLVTAGGTVFNHGANTNGAGGAGSTHFRMPDARGRANVMLGTHLDVSTLSRNDALAVGSRTSRHRHRGLGDGPGFDLIPNGHPGGNAGGGDMRAAIGSASGDASSINFIALSAVNPNTGGGATGTYAVNGSGTSGRGFSHYTPVYGYTSESFGMPYQVANKLVRVR